MAFAPTRSGKGVGLVIPTLLSWTESVVVHDIKGENWQLTAGWRAKFSHCLLFNPTDPRSARYNPLLEVRKGPNEVRDVQNIADILVDPEGALERRTHWEKTSHRFAGRRDPSCAVRGRGEDAGARRNLPLRSAALVRAHLARDDGDQPSGHAAKPIVHPVVASAAREVLNKSENERSGVLVHRHVVPGPLSRSDGGGDDRGLRLAHRRSGRCRTPGLALSGRPALRHFADQAAGAPGAQPDRPASDRAARRRSRQTPPASASDDAGRVSGAGTARFLRDGARLHGRLRHSRLSHRAIAQPDFQGLWREQRHPRQLPCPHRVFVSNDERTAKRISDALGTATELRAQRNYAGHRLSPWLSHVMVSRQETARPLLTPGEVMQLPPADELVLVSGLAPIRAKKLRYYEDRNFTRARSSPRRAFRWTALSRPARPRGPTIGAGRCAASDARLQTDDAAASPATTPEDEGGLQKQRHPGLPEKAVSHADHAANADDRGLLDDDDDDGRRRPRDGTHAAGCDRARPCDERRRASRSRRSASGLLRTTHESPPSLLSRGSVDRNSLEQLAAKPGVSRSAIVADAVRAYLDRRGADELDDRFKVRLDKLSQQLSRIERDVGIVMESLALFVRYQFMTGSPLAGIRTGRRARRRPGPLSSLHRAGRPPYRQRQERCAPT